MAEKAPFRIFDWFEHHPLWRVILYYTVFVSALYYFDQNVQVFHDTFMQGVQLADPGAQEFSKASFEIAVTASQQQTAILGAGKTAVIAMLLSFLLALPVVWIYAFSRQKRGYQQSLAQTLVLLPIVVAGVVILVKNSIALAFSLGGIVGAVAFRNRLEDTKDAINVFMAIAIGLACGAQTVPTGLAISGFFNVAILLLWYTDFGRMPGDMQAPVAQKRVELAKEMAGGEGGKKTEKLVTALDQQLLQSMTPDQLQMLADRALQRKTKMSHELLDTDATEERFEGTVRVTTIPGASADAIREAVEKVLAREAKEWAFAQAGMGDEGRATLDWQVRSKKSVPRPILLESIRRAIAGQAEVTFK